jgi:glycosyltransferase involved in cell wall biosynthesis
VIPAISIEASGPTYIVRRLCEAVRAAGLEARVAALDWSLMNGVPDYARLFPLGLGPRRLGRSPALARWLTEEARAGRIELLHNHGLWMMPNVYPGWVARRFGVPYVVSPHGTLGEWPFNNGSPVKRVFWPLVQKPALAAVTCWHATSDAEYADIRRMGFREPVAVIPNGIDVSPRVPKEPRRPRTLLYLGRLHPIKGLGWLLSAWAAVEHRFPEWCLRIVGPDERGHLAELIAQGRALGLKRVAFHGPVYGEERWRAYAEAEIFVLPTRHENFGLVVAEALAAGTPVITTHGAPWAGLPRHDCGWWIEPGVEPLVACLEEALACSSERLAEMGQAGRAWMDTEFSWRAIGARMAAVYRWLLHGFHKPADVISN